MVSSTFKSIFKSASLFVFVLSLTFSSLTISVNADTLPGGEVRFSDVDPNTSVYTDWIYDMDDRNIRPFKGYKDGTWRPLEASLTRTRIANSIYDSVISAGLTFPQSINSCQPYADVSSTHANYISIQTLKCNGIMTAYAGKNFRGGQLETRENAVIYVIKTLLKFNKISPSTISSTTANTVFSDIPAGYSNTGYISAAYDLGLISGYANKTGGFEFRPTAKIVRGGQAKLLSKTLDIL